MVLLSAGLPVFFQPALKLFFPLSGCLVFPGDFATRVAMELARSR
jgi:hypothetical protein